MSSKTTNSTTMFIYIAMVIMGVPIIASLTNYFSFSSILRAICGMTIIFGYYLLTQRKKVGLIVMWLGTLFYALTLQILGPEGAIVSISISSEIILDIFVIFAVLRQLKNYS